ncbi:MAG: hypothetical protein U0263_15990 [Polyangiaceae bacterium]
MSQHPFPPGFLAVSAALTLSLLLACGGGTYSPSCKRAVDVTAPWTGLRLPVSEGRVCSSTPTRLEVQFTKGNREKWAGAFESALLGEGFSKKSCASNYCSFERGPERIQVIALETAKWRSVVLNKL